MCFLNAVISGRRQVKSGYTDEEQSVCNIGQLLREVQRREVASSDLDDRQELPSLERGWQTDEDGASPGYVDRLGLSGRRHDWSG